MKKVIKVSKKRIISAIVAVTLIIGSISLAAGESKISASVNSGGKGNTESVKERLQKARNELHEIDNNTSEYIRVVVELNSDAVSDKESDKFYEYDTKIKFIENKLEKKQDTIIKKIEKITGKKVINRTTYLANSVTVEATSKQIEEILKVDGVANVYETEEYEVTMENAIDYANVEEVWNNEKYGYTGEGMVIAVIDTGVNYKHRDMALAANVVTKYTEEEWKEKIKLLGHGEYKTRKVPFAYDYQVGINDSLAEDKGFIADIVSTSAHGYHVSGIAAANGKLKGVAKNAQVLGMKVLGNKKGYCTSDAIVQAIEDAVKLGADVVNMSLGLCCVPVNEDDYLQSVINEASKAGIVFCISASNSGNSGSVKSSNTNEYCRKDTTTVNTPGVSNSAITVAACKNSLDSNAVEMAYFSSWGPTNELGIKPEITAPGENINSLMSGKNKYGVYSGTSMAAPYIAGCTAVLKQAVMEKKININSDNISNYLKNCLMNTSKPLYDLDGNPYSVRYQGAGLVDLENAVKNDVIATCEGQAKVELKEVKKGENKTFEIQIHNYGKDKVSYALENTQIYTDYNINDNLGNKYGIKAVENSKIIFNTDNITVLPGQSASVKGEVILGSNFVENQYIEAYVRLSGSNGVDLGLPVLGFYGDWSNETIVDTPVYEGKSLIGVEKGTGLVEDCKDASSLYYGTELKYSTEREATSNIACNENIEDFTQEDANTVLESERFADLNSKTANSYLYKIKDNLNLYPYIKENKDYPIKHMGKGISFAIYKSKEAGNINIQIKAEYTKFSIMTFEKNDSNNRTVSKNCLQTVNESINVSEGTLVLIIFKKLGDFTKDDKYGRIKITRSNNSEITEIIETYNGELASFSPNNDKVSDKVYPVAVNIRSSIDTDIYVLDKNKNIIRTLAKDLVSSKHVRNVLKNELYGVYEPFSYNLYSRSYVHWDGKVYNSKSQEYEYVPDGQYYIQIDSRIKKDDLPQTVVMPIKVDTVKPTIDKFEIIKENNNTILKFKNSDNIGFSAYYYVDIKFKEKKKSISFGNSYIETDIDDKGSYYLNLGNIGDADITFMVEDQAGNQTISSTLNNTQDIKFNTRENGVSDIESLLSSKKTDKSKKVFKESIIWPDMLNENEEYFIEGVLDEKYTKLVINGKEVELNLNTRKYTLLVPLIKGTNLMTIQYYRGDKIETLYEKVYYDIIRLRYEVLSNYNSIDKENNYIITDSEYIDINCIVNSYIHLDYVEINGDTVYASNEATLVEGGNSIEKAISHKIKLHKGINNIQIKITNIIGHVGYRLVKVERK